MKLIYILVSAGLLFGCTNSNSSELDRENDNPLVGAWKVVSTYNVTSGEFEDEPNHYYHVFTPSHHMIFVAGENREKIEKNFWRMTPEEIKSQLPTGGGFMEYEIEGNTFHSTYITAMSAHYEGVEVDNEFEFRDDTLVIRNDHYLDGNMREWKLVNLE